MVTKNRKKDKGSNEMLGPLSFFALCLNIYINLNSNTLIKVKIYF